MCVVSNIYDLGQQVPQEYWTSERLNDFRQVVKMAEKVDQEEGNPDCEDPSKAAWFAEVEARLSKLEKHVARLEYDLTE